MKGWYITMIYTNVDTAVKTRSVGLEKRHFVSVGAQHKPILLRTRPELEFKKGLNEKLSLVWDERGKMHLERMEDNTFFMLLYAENETANPYDGRIKVYYNHQENVRFIARFGQRDCIMLDVKDPSVGALIQIRPYDFDQGAPAELYVIYDWKVYRCTPESLRKCCEENNIEVSDALHIDEIDVRNENDWVTL
ncbi:MAG: hypothetical protein IJO08_00095 [Clostridia bacterium]|nr:hypothetical protein [Clostridia bacterium]